MADEVPQSGPPATEQGKTGVPEKDVPPPGITAPTVSGAVVSPAETREAGDRDVPAPASAAPIATPEPVRSAPAAASDPAAKPETAPAPEPAKAPGSAAEAGPAADTRGRWTIRSAMITPELLTAVRKAADRAGMKQGDWIADRLFRTAVDELKRETLPGPTLEDTAKALADIRARLEEQKPDPRLDEIAAGLAAIGEKIERPTRADARMGALMDYMVELRNEVKQTRQQVTERRGGVISRLFGKG